MSTQVFPTLTGLEYNVKRSPIWSTITQNAVSGKRVAIALWSYPKYLWEMSFSYLPSTAANADFQNLLGFFNKMTGSYNTFLYADADDYTVTDQAVGTGDGTTAAFQLVRTLGGFAEPVLAPHTVTNVKVDGVDKTAFVTVSNWGTTTPGLITFAGGHIPTAAQAITATFTYYFPVHFTDDQMNFNLFMSQVYENKSVTFLSEK